ncbi:Splicing factor 3B subunit 4 [Chionoecetes opilio]|uniref:Splicing factor 3B subunit 4 n=1 Tax=Chionoecetes opilio TaxID=41210 RepID=A0A8J4YAL6_CHIOP|nr:Splicing factor 3B subunit 4 [Chionoecetes opilio]
MKQGQYAPLGKDATIYVGGLDDKVSEGLLWELFVQAGPVVNVHMPKDRVTQQHQGYGFVEFMGEEDADYAIKIMNMIKTPHSEFFGYNSILSRSMFFFMKTNRSKLKKVRLASLAFMTPDPWESSLSKAAELGMAVLYLTNTSPRWHGKRRGTCLLQQLVLLFF